MFKLANVIFALSALVSCERSNRTVEVLPNTNNVNQDGNGTGTGKGGFGSLVLRLSNLPSKTTSASVRILIDGEPSTADVKLTDGSGKTTIENLPLGSSQQVIVKATIESVLYIGRASVNIDKDSRSTATIPMEKDSGGDTGGTGGTGGTGTADVNINVDVGGQQAPPSGTNLWDGKSFKGNSQFTIKPVQ